MKAISLQEQVSDVQVTEQVLLFPTFGHLAADGRTWKVGVSGAVFRLSPDKLRQRFLLRILRRIMKIDAEQAKSQLFQERVKHFLVSTERGKRLSIEVGGRTVELQRPTKRNGHFRGWIHLNPEEAEQLAENGFLQTDRLDFQLLLQSNDQRNFFGSAQLIGDDGVSVISDIDDTIKISNVGHRAELLNNTFLRKFRSVEGMSAFYQRLAAEGAAFHYVSSSPWQLFPSLSEWLADGGFPDGSIHLRAIRLRDPSVLRLFVGRRNSKRRVIHSIIRMFPRRRYLLVGDSGEKDMEIYGAIARRFPAQIEQILIRGVGVRRPHGDRVLKAFRNIPPQKWKFFESADELDEFTTLSH